MERGSQYTSDMMPGHCHDGQSGASNSRADSRQVGLKRPRPGASTGALSSNAMPPPRPKSQQGGSLDTGRASTPTPTRSERTGKPLALAPTAAVADVCRIRGHALPAISSALFNADANNCTGRGRKRGRACDGSPAAQQVENASSPNPPERQRHPCNDANRNGDKGDSISGDDSGGGRSASGTRLRTATATVTAVTVSRVLQLGHGATATCTPRSNGEHNINSSSSTGGEGPRWAPQSEGAEERESDAGGGVSGGGAAEAEVVVGVLVFESVREGDVAVSSLFLQDETGERETGSVTWPDLTWLDLA